LPGGYVLDAHRLAELNLEPPGELLGALRAAGYDGTVSVEHEDRLLGAEAGLARAVALLLRVRPGD